MAWYSYPSGNYTSILNLMSYANSVTNDVFGRATLITIWLVAFLASKRWETPIAFAFASFVTMIVALIFRIGNIIGTNDLVVATTMVFVAFLVLKFER